MARSKSKFTFIIMAVLILLIFLHYLGVVSLLENFLVRTASPLQALIFRTSQNIQRVSIFQKSSRELAQENKELSQQLAMLHIENQKLKNSLEEERLLLSSFGYLEERKIQSIPASILSKDSLNNAQIVVINKGLRHKVQKNYPVLIGDGLLVGKVIESEREFSRVLLITDIRSQIAATFSDYANTQGVVTGHQGQTMKIELISKDTPVKIKDIIITSGQQEFIPRGLIIGEVTRIEKTNDGFFQTAFVSSLFSLHTQSVVSVIIP